MELIILLLLQIIYAAELKYVFEITRHGARAPIKEDLRFTMVPKEMLTPQGMR